MADVKVAQNAAGDYALGVEHEGVFVPLASIAAARVGHYVERQQTLEQRAGENDEVAQQALDEGFSVKSSRRAKSKSEAEPETDGEEA